MPDADADRPASLARTPSNLRDRDATAILRRRLDPGLTVTGQRKLYGGSIHRVVEWFTDGEPASVVVKLNNADSVEVFRREFASLQLFRETGALPVPEPWAVVHDEPGFDGSGLLMQRIPGVPLGDATLSAKGVDHFERDLARHVVHLHRHRRETYGSALQPAGPGRWLDSFAPLMEAEFGRVRDQLPSPTRRFIDDLLRRLDQWLPEEGKPTLVHSDLWANNLLIDDAHPDRPRILAFIDSQASYCDPEYELAYLQLFQTANRTFFDAYRRHHAIRPGFRRRARVYWLNTMLLHVRVFGRKYLASCEDVVRQLRSL